MIQKLIDIALARLRDELATLISQPDYFDALTRAGTYTVQLTPQGTEPFLLSYADFAGGSFHVYGSKPNGAFAWEVKAIRADIDPLEVETPVEEPQEMLV